LCSYFKGNLWALACYSLLNSALRRNWEILCGLMWKKWLGFVVQFGRWRQFVVEDVLLSRKYAKIEILVWKFNYVELNSHPYILNFQKPLNLLMKICNGHFFKKNYIFEVSISKNKNCCRPLGTDRTLSKLRPKSNFL